MADNKLCFILCLLLVGLFGRRASADSNSETKLRETLRNTMLQLRTAQNERATLQASQAENEAKVKALTAQVEKLTKEATAAEKTGADQQAQLTKFKEASENWQTAYKQAVDLASTKEAARAELANENIALKRRVEDQKTKNAAMYRTANEILTRYERFGLGDALAAKEPFVGITRVKLENLVQDYQDKLLDARTRNSDTVPAKKQPTPNRAQQSPTPSKSAQKQSPNGTR